MSLSGADQRPPGYYVNSWAARTSQRLAGRIVDSMIAFGCIVAVVVLGPHGRPLAQDLIIVALVATIESVAITRTGATLGMHVVDIRVAPLLRSGRPDFWTAWRRSVPVALCYAVLLPGTFVALIMPAALVLSIALSPLRRAFHDRSSGTVVVQVGAPARITEADTALWWQPQRAVVMSPWGRVPDLYDRRRARAHRVDGAWWLAAVVMVMTIASVGIADVPNLWLWSTAIWLVAITVDEVWWVTNKGATPGHLHAGYRIVDLATGTTPTRSRALLRAVVVGPLLYIPPLQLVLALWVRASALHRGPHDLIANTVVVEPGYEPVAFAPPPAPVALPAFPPGPTWYPPPLWHPPLPPPPPSSPPPPTPAGPPNVSGPF